MVESFLIILREIPIYLTLGFAFISILPFFLMPLYFRRLPRDYFLKLDQNTKSGFVEKLIKNLLGLVTLFIGFILLFLPGQGVILMIFGITLLSFPGKNKLIVKLFSSEKTRKTLNSFRGLLGVEPFLWFENDK